MSAAVEAVDAGPTAADSEAARALARQKARASALVAFCAVVYAFAKAFEGWHPAVAYVAAFAEAAIIGALADWYAVVALFRRPLGLPLPHTAIIPANQTRIAEAIGNFIVKHFLAGERVREKVLELDPAASAGRWLAVPANRHRVAVQVARLLPEAIEAVDREMLRGEIERSLLDGLAALDIGQITGALLETVTRGDRHHAILDDMIARIETLLAEPPALSAIRERIRAELPTLVRFFQADAYVLHRLVRASQDLLKEVRQDAAHPLRAEFDRLIAEFVDRLKDSSDHGANADRLKRELLARPEVREILVEGWQRFFAALQADVARDDGVIPAGVSAFLADIAQKLQHDADLRARLNTWLAERATDTTERYKHEVAAFVSEQVKSWDTRHAVRTIELSIGKDLQYIRINGAMVGGLLGLAIFTATRLAMG
jgi:uncharacterized membrane-anchored protein YjiN (DUF445 family)